MPPLGGPLSQAIVHALPLVVIWLDEEGRITYANPFFETLVGRSLDTFIGKDWFSTFLPVRDHERLREVFRRTLQSGATETVVNRIVTATGEERDIEWSARFVSTKPQAGLIGIGKDVTDKLRAERQQRVLEQKLGNVFDASADCMAMYVLDGDEFRAEALNRSYRGTLDALCGGSSESAPFETMTRRELLLRLGTPDCQIEVELDRFRSAVNEGVPVLFRQECRPLGTFHEITLTPFHDRNSGQTQLLWVSRNVTESWKANEALRKSEALLSESQRLAKLGSWELCLDTGVLTWSNEVYRMFGKDKNQFIASYESFLEAIHPDDREMVNAAYQESLANHTSYEVHHRLLKEDGTVSYVVERGESEFDETGAPLRSVGTVQDVTQNRRDAETLRISLREKETLLREVHHRVKNNLQIISSLLHFQAKRVANAEDRNAFDEGRQRLFAMVLVHEKLYQSKELSNVDFGDYVRSLVGSLLESSNNSERIDVEVVADEVRLPIENALPCGMILCELIMNVFKYAYPKGGEMRAMVKIGTDGELIEMSIVDYGVGFPEEFRSTMATSFGWQLVRNLVAQIDGEVEAFSDDGAHVVVRFPQDPQPRCPSSETSKEP